MTLKVAKKQGKAKCASPMAAAGATAPQQMEPVNSDLTIGAASRIQMRRLDQIKPHPLNAQLYGGNCPADFIQSIKQSGVQVPLIVTPANVLISGSQRLTAAKLAGLSEVPVIEKTAMNEEQTRLLLIECNTGRRKTTEHLIREYREIKRIEKSFAAKRQGTRTDLRPDLAGSTAGRARDFAAARIGLSASTLETGVKIIEIIEEKSETDNMHTVEEVRTILNDGSISEAEKKLREVGWWKSGVAKPEALSEPKAAAQSPETSRQPSVIQAPEPPKDSRPASPTEPLDGTPDLFENEPASDTGCQAAFVNRFMALYQEICGQTPTSLHLSCVNDAVREFARQVLGGAVNSEVQ